MQYISTRSSRYTADSADAVLKGIAEDGGLFTAFPDSGFDWKGTLSCNAREISERVLGALLPDFPDIKGIVERSYKDKFETEELTPVKKVGDKYVLELFRGPTCAFKDVALSVLPQLITEAKKLKGDTREAVILTATSGDTGKAALEGFHDVEGTKIIVFYPYRGVSLVQELQMTTQKGGNVRVCAVRGNFDDAQAGVKNVFAALSGKMPETKTLSSANSINIGRLAPQVMYYFKAYADLVRAGRIGAGDRVNFTVPTGNFGDILAGCFAKLMGLPVGKLVCASNRNRVLTDFLETGVYDRRREFYKTDSPSMDILVSSNLERLLYLMSGDFGYVAGLMKDLRDNGVYRISKELLSKLSETFEAGSADDAEGAAAINGVWNRYGYLMDTHTAVAWSVAERLSGKLSNDPMVVLSTASPYKFPAAVLSALGEAPGGDGFEVMERLESVTGVPVPKALRGLKESRVLHTDVIEKDDMLRYVLKCMEEE